MTRVTLSRLYLEELRALPRGRFALAGAAVLAALLSFAAIAIGTNQSGLWGFAILAYGIGPTLVGSAAAAQMAGLRTTRFGQSLFTTPVRAIDVFGAKLLVSLTLAAAYFVATLPFIAVGSVHVGLPEGVERFMLAGGAILLFAVALGSCAGVFLSRSAAGAIALTTGFLVLALFAMPYAAALLGAPGGGDRITLQLLHLSPHLLASDAVGLMESDAGMAVASPARAFALLAIEIVVLLGAAAWAYTREQGVEGWDGRPGRRAVLVGLVALVLVAPVVAADPKYTRVSEGGEHGRLAMAQHHNATFLALPPGVDHRNQFGEFTAGTWDSPLWIGESNERDLLVLVNVEEGAALSDVRVTVEGDPRIAIERGASADLGDVATQERASTWSHGPFRMPFESGAVLRVPVTLRPTDPLDMSTNWYVLHVNVTYGVDGETRHAGVVTSLRADVPGAKLQMAAAGAPLFLLSTIAALVRRARVG